MNEDVPLRLLIRVNGDHDIGLGHVFRMRLLGERWAHGHGSVGFCTFAGTVATEILGEIPAQVFPVPRDNPEYVPSDVEKGFAPDIVVLDILQTDSSRFDALRAGTPARVVVFDDIGAGWRQADAAINALACHWGAYTSTDCPIPLYEGPDYLILNPTVRANGGKSRQIPGRARHVVLAFGGTDDRSITARVVRALNDVPGPMTITINLGPGALKGGDIEAAGAASPHNIAIRRSTPSLIDLIDTADLLICNGGMTAYEAAALGVPSAAIAAEPFERHNIEFLARSGATCDLGTETRFDAESIAAAVGPLIADGEARRAMSDNGKRTVDGRGLERCLEAIGNLAQ